MNDKYIKKRLLIKLAIGVILIYAVSWVVYGFGYLNAKHSISSHYGATVKIKECTGGANGKDIIVNGDTLVHDVYQNNGVTKLVPALLLPFLSFDDYKYVYYYSLNHDIRQASGRTNALGNLRESSNTHWEYRCVLA